MANEQEEQGKWFEVKNEKGEVVKSLYAPKGGALYDELSSGSGQVYKPNREDEEEYVSVSEAKVNTSIDPYEGTITLSGPKWLIGEVVDSDSFKKNYTENKALLNAINAYRTNPDSTVVDPTNGNPIKVSDIIKSYQDGANSYANAYTQIKDYKLDAQSKYGVNFSDENVYTANNFHSKEDYDANGVIYIPNWAKNMYKWDDLESWDEEHRAVSAKDFFETVYKEDFDNNTASSIQNGAKDWMDAFAKYNVYDRDDKDEAAAHQSNIEDEGYADEAARTIQMFNIVSQNRPDIGAAYNATMFTVGALQTWAQDAANAVGSVSSGIMQGIEGICGVIPTEVDDFVLSPVYLSAGLIGEITNGVQEMTDPRGSDTAVTDWLSNFKKDIDAAFDFNAETSAGNNLDVRRQEFNAAYEELSREMQNITGAYVAGEKVGHIAWKITENVLVLDKIGKGIEGAITAWSLAPGVASTMSKFMSAEAVGKVFKILGKSTNIIAQGILETYFDDKDLLNKAIASGNIFDEGLWGKLAENIIWNGLAEGLGGGASYFLKQTSPGQAISLMLEKPVNAIAKTGNNAKVLLSMRLHRWTPEQLAEAIQAVSQGATKGLSAEMMNTAFTKMVANYQDLASRISVFGKTGEDIANTINEAVDVLQIGKAPEMAERVAKMQDEIAKEGTEEAAEAVAKDAEDIAKAADVPAPAAKTSNIKTNYELYQKTNIMRANLENQMDMITKGVSIEQTRMNEAAKEELEEFQAAGNKVTKLEGENPRLTQFEEGSILSKEGSQYLSWSSQIGQYKWRLSQLDGLESTSKEYGDILNRFFHGSSKEVDELTNFVRAVDDKLDELGELLGDDLRAAYDELLPKAGAYFRANTDYMILHGYYTDEEVKSILRARAQGWGEGGINYIPTRRLFGDDAELGFSTDLTKASKDTKNALFFNRKSASDGLYRLVPGDVDTEFADPIMTLFYRQRNMAAVAQAQEMARTIRSASIASRGVTKFSDTGITKYDLNLFEKGVEGVKKEFNSAFFDSNGAFDRILKEKFTETNAFGAAFNQKNFYKKFTESRSKLKAATRDLRDVSTPSAKYQYSLIRTLPEADADTIIAAMPEDVVAPSFNIRGLRAATLDDWWASIPKRTQKTIEKMLKEQNYSFNVTNVKKVFNNNDELVPMLKRDFIYDQVYGNTKSFKDNVVYTGIMKQRFAASEYVNKMKLTSAQAKYEKALTAYNKVAAQGEGMPVFKANDIKTLGEDFSKSISEVYTGLVEDMQDALRGTKAFDDLAKNLLDNGGGAFNSLEEAEEYIILTQLNKKSAKQLAAPLTNAKNGMKSLAETSATTAAGNAKQGATYARDLANSFGSGLKQQITDRLDEFVGGLKMTGHEDVLDLGEYWDSVKKCISDIEQKGGFSIVEVGKGQPSKLKYDLSRIVQMVDADGQVKFFEVDPMAAVMTNAIPNFSKETASNAIQSWGRTARGRLSQFFRFGTTGIDIPSYLNQWFRDPLDATIMGFARPFTDLNAGSIKNVGAALIWDSVPGVRATKIGQKLFGDNIVSNITEGVINTTYKSTQKALVDEFGEDWWKEFSESATKGLTGEEAEAALRRATVEFSASSIGANALPNMGGMTTAKFFRSSTGEEVALSDVRKEQLNAMFGQGGKVYGEGMTSSEKATFRQAQRSFMDKVDDIMEKSSRGDFRETFMRKNVFVSQYNAAINAGMSAYDARIWATRYALDATTDFGRTFMFANDFIHSVPYLGAAINGHKSFMRLLTLDPAGMYGRFLNGLVFPYMMMTVESLSDPRNREVYKTIHEYEKEDSIFIVYKGEKLQLPIPQQLARFLAPFRHAVEKAADVQDISWWRLALSDTLGMMPLDLSGFANLDGTDLLTDGEDGIWNNISRGAEKAASTLMDPLTKSIYMVASGRDPYTGRNIDTSYTYLDENGEPQVMDSTKSDIANWLHSTFPDLSASAALKLTQTLFGRSTISVLDGLVGTVSGSANPASAFNWLADQVQKPIDGGSSYDVAKSEWRNAINKAYEMREAMLNDDVFTKALSAIRNSNTPESKREGALRTYNEKMDEFSRFVLDIASSMKERYPDQYTRTRAAQIVSLLTMPTGYSNNNTEYARQLQTESYYDSRAAAIHTYIDMGFPEDYAGQSILGSGYFDKTTGKYKFKEFTPYQIEMMNSEVFGSSDQFTAMIQSAMKSADISPSDKWTAYYSAKDKAERKEISAEWNKNIVKQLYPLFSRYGADSILGSSATRDVLEDYLLISNPFKAKQYMYEIFGGTQ